MMNEQDTQINEQDIRTHEDVVGTNTQHNEDAIGANNQHDEDAAETNAQQNEADSTAAIAYERGRARERLHVVLFCVIFVTLLATLIAISGNRLARHDSSSRDNARLIGVFITTEHLDIPSPHTGPIRVGWRGQVDFSELFRPGRIYAQWCEDTFEFSFPGVDGIPFFVARSPGRNDSLHGAAAQAGAQSLHPASSPVQEGPPIYPPLPITDDDLFLFSDPHPFGPRGPVYITQAGSGIVSGGTHLSFGDNSVGIEISGTIYAVPGAQVQAAAFLNKVFQCPEGYVFLETGHGFSFHGVTSEGDVMRQTISETRTMVENGVETSYSISVDINHSAMFAPVSIVVLQMDTNSQVVMRTELSPEDVRRQSEVLPTQTDNITIYLESQTEYVVVETHRAISPEVGRPVLRELVSRRETGVRTFAAREDGILEAQWLRVVWPGTE